MAIFVGIIHGRPRRGQMPRSLYGRVGRVGTYQVTSIMTWRYSFIYTRNTHFYSWSGWTGAERARAYPELRDMICGEGGACRSALVCSGDLFLIIQDCKLICRLCLLVLFTCLLGSLGYGVGELFVCFFLPSACTWIPLLGDPGRPKGDVSKDLEFVPPRVSGLCYMNWHVAWPCGGGCLKALLSSAGASGSSDPPTPPSTRVGLIRCVPHVSRPGETRRVGSFDSEKRMWTHRGLRQIVPVSGRGVTCDFYSQPGRREIPSK